MNLHVNPAPYRPQATLRLSCLSAIFLLAVCGCKSKPAPADDATLTNTIQTLLASDTSIAGQPIQPAVQSGVVTLNGSVSNAAQRTLAARDAAGVPGVREVVNNLAVLSPPPSSASVSTPPPQPVPVPASKSTQLVSPASRRDQHTDMAPERSRQPAPIERQQQAYNPAPPPQPYTQPAVQAPPSPPPPSFRSVTVPSGNSIPVRITQTLDSASTQQGDTFSGVVSSNVVVEGLVAIPAGAAVSGHVDAVQEAAHFKGSSLLTVSLGSISRRGENISITTDPYTVKGKGRGANTAEKTGGGAAVGAILGGIFGGGKGAAIGAAAGGGVGAGSNAITRGQQVQIPSETIVRFQLAAPITVRVRTDGPRQNDTPDLSHRPDPS